MRMPRLASRLLTSGTTVVAAVVLLGAVAHQGTANGSTGLPVTTGARLAHLSVPDDGDRCGSTGTRRTRQHPATPSRSEIPT